MLPPSSQKKSSQREDFDMGSHASHHLKNNPPKGRIPKRWDKTLVQEILPEGRIIDRILLVEGYLHISTFYSVECILTELPLISISRLFPHDWMHLCLENHGKNLVSFWKGMYKGMDEGWEEYQILDHVWAVISKETATASNTIPASFG